jgi:hypothetical protein
LVDQLALYGGTHDIIVIKRLSMSFLLRNQNTGYIVYSFLIGFFFAYEGKRNFNNGDLFDLSVDFGHLLFILLFHSYCVYLAFNLKLVEYN